MCRAGPGDLGGSRRAGSAENPWKIRSYLGSRAPAFNAVPCFAPVVDLHCRAMAQLVKASVVLSLACGASALVASGDPDSDRVPLKACGAIASAAEKARKGDRDGVAKTMHEVCARKSLDAQQSARCQRMTTDLLDAAKVDGAHFTSEDDPSELCANFWDVLHMSEQEWAAFKEGQPIAVDSKK